jgi:hypothetical protein
MGKPFQFFTVVASILLCMLQPTQLLAEELLDTREQRLISHVVTSLQNAEQKISKIDDGVLTIHGLSSPKVRHLLNNLCSLEGAVYLEIGCWKGSTLVAALYGNELNMRDAVAIENWSEFEGPRLECFANIQKFIPHAPLRFFEANCFSINQRQTLPLPVNVYFYDGRHETQDQELAFTHFNDEFDEVFIAVVDDWNWDSVRIGTDRAFKKLNYEVLFQKALFTNSNGDMESWWNGLYVAVIKKRKT